MPLEASQSLLVGQYFDSPRLQSAVQAPIDALQDDVIASFDELELMRQIDTAVGVWLDYLGARVGLRRPFTNLPDQDVRFGFEGPDQSQGFDQAPFSGDSVNDAVFPLPDQPYRQLIKARAVLVLGDGTFQTFVRAVRLIDATAGLRDERDMTIRVATSNRVFVELADRVGALPRNAGVMLEFVERGRFGYDEAGVGFDQGPFRSGVFLATGIVRPFEISAALSLGRPQGATS